MEAAEKVHYHRGSKEVMCWTHLVEDTAGEFELVSRGVKEIACYRVAKATPKKLWLLVKPPVRDFVFCDSASITAEQNKSAFVNVVGVSASVLENCCEVFGWTVP